MKKLANLFLLLLHVTPMAIAQQSFNVPGNEIDHSPKSSGRYIGSPSICIFSNGHYLASHDYFGKNSNERTAA